MKSKEAIEIEFAKAINEAQELESIAGSLSSIANSIISKDIVSLEQAWKGNCASALSMKSRNLSSEMLTIAQNLFGVAKSIRTTAELVYKAEKAALFMALSR